MNGATKVSKQFLKVLFRRESKTWAAKSGQEVGSGGALKIQGGVVGSKQVIIKKD